MSAAPAPRPNGTAAVFDVLARSRATLLHSASLGDGLDVALWRNGEDETEYRRPGHHTLSLYLSGGERTFRADQPRLRGAPGMLCLLPAGHESHWVVGGEQRFLHLYFRAEQLAPLALRLLGREPRDVGLPELTFVQPQALVAPLQAIARLDWRDPQARLHANALGHGVLAELVGRHGGRAVPTGRRRGGLSPVACRRLVERIDAELHRPLTVGEMAAWVPLSEHHFAEAFRESIGQTPHAFVLARRIDRAKTLLRRHPHWPLSRIADACGLASASHLVRRFQAQTGCPPAQWKRLQPDGQAV